MVNWFPGHMKKSLNQLDEKIKLVDIVIEVADARAVLISRNPVFHTQGRPHLLILNKSDLADINITSKVANKLRQQQITPLLFDKFSNRKIIIEAINLALKEKKEKAEQKNIRFIPRALICGIPNVGKSTIINCLKKGGGVKVENRPGVTRGFTFVKLKDLELLDSPGILPPRLDSAEISYTLLAIGCIRDDIIDWGEAANYVINYLLTNYPSLIKNRFGIEDVTLENIAQRRGLLLSKGQLDTDKAAQLIIREVRNGLIGNISYDN